MNPCQDTPLVGLTSQPMSEWTDEELFKHHIAAGGSDTPAFEILVGRYRRTVTRYLRCILRDYHLAEDVMQEAILSAHQARGQFVEGRKFKAWFLTIAINRARDLLRNRQVRPCMSFDSIAVKGDNRSIPFSDIVLSDDSGPDLLLLDEEKRVLVRQMIATMTPNQRGVIEMAYFQQMSYIDMAQQLSIPIGTLKSRLHAAVHAFGRRWSKTHETCPA